MERIRSIISPRKVDVKQKKEKYIHAKTFSFCSNEGVKSVLMWGVNYSIKQLIHTTPKPVLLGEDFQSTLKVSIHNHFFMRDNLPDQFCFKEYCPLVFQDLRFRFHVTSEGFLESLTKHQPLRRMHQSNKRSDMMLSWDKKFAIIPISNDHCETLLQNLEAYHAHIVSWKGDTRLPKWLALYRITIADKVTRFLVATNWFFPPGRSSHKYVFCLNEDTPGKKCDLGKYANFGNEPEFVATESKISISPTDKNELWLALRRDLLFITTQRLTHPHIFLGLISFEKSMGKKISSVSSYCNMERGLTLTFSEDEPLPSAIAEEPQENSKRVKGKQFFFNALPHEKGYGIPGIKGNQRVYFVGLNFLLKKRHNRQRPLSPHPSTQAIESIQDSPKETGTLTPSANPSPRLSEIYKQEKLTALTNFFVNHLEGGVS